MPKFPVEQVREIKKRFKARFPEFGIGIGELDDEPCLNVYVQQPSDRDKVPPTFEGLKTNVIVTGTIKPISRAEAEAIASRFLIQSLQTQQTPRPIQSVYAESDGKGGWLLCVGVLNESALASLASEFEGLKIVAKVVGCMEPQGH